METTRLTVRLGKDLQKRLRKLARRRSQPTSELVRQALESFCQAQEKQRSCYDIAKEAGIIGIAKDLPPDLSTNPKYMEGFGES